MFVSVKRVHVLLACHAMIGVTGLLPVHASPPDSSLTEVVLEDLTTLRPQRASHPSNARTARIATRSATDVPADDFDLKRLEVREGDDVKRLDDARLDYTGRLLVPMELSQTVERLKPSLQQTLRHYYNDMEYAHERSNWGMMHAILVYGNDTQVIANRQRYSTIAWVAGNNPCRGKRFFEEDQRGIKVKSGVGLQGHQGQFLMVCGLTGIPSSYPLYVNGNEYSIEDLIRREQEDCRSGEELTFAFTGLIHYLDTDASWKSSDGQRWDFERLIAEELSQPVIGAACGGTHRLMILSHALRSRRAEGKPIAGQWARAEQFLDDFVDYAFTLQNRDGSWSTNWFAGREDNGDTDRKIQTTGHIAEWLLTTLPDSQLQDPRLVRAIAYVNSTMYRGRDREWSIGPKGHANRSLRLFYERVYQTGPAWSNP